MAEPASPLARDLLAPTSLWACAYGALALNLCSLAWLIQWPRHGVATPWVYLIAPAVLIPIAWFVNGTRVLLHDWLLSLVPRERVLLALLSLVTLFAPAFLTGYRVPLDGVLWTAIYLLLIAGRAAVLRCVLLVALLGAFFAAWPVGAGLAAGLLLTGFGATWLAAAGLVHVALVGQSHGLSGGWALRRIAAHAALASLAGLAAGAVVYVFWPATGMHRGRRILRMPAPETTVRRMEQLDVIQLLWMGLMTLVLAGLVIGMLVYLRRWLLGRVRGGAMAESLPGQVSELNYQALEPEEERPQLEGIRGQMVALWSRWAATLEQGGCTREPGETARQFAERLRIENMEVAPPEEMTCLFEAAHYGDPVPVAADLARMQQIVMEEIERLARQNRELRK